MKTKIALFDAHSFDKDLATYRLNAENSPFKYSLFRSGDKPIDANLIFISDGLTQTRLPFFFPRSKRVAWLKESPSHTRKFSVDLLRKSFDVVLTHRADLIRQGPPFYRVDFSANWIYPTKKLPVKYEKTKAVSFIGSIEHPRQGGYVLRQDVAQALQRRNDIDCYGKGINPIESKLAALQDYRFSIAMENVREDYYYTEKIIDCFLTETVPIYWGCPSISSVFDSRGIITFESLAELERVLADLSVERYLEILPYAKKNKELCQQQRLADYDGYLERCVEAALGAGMDIEQTVKPWRMSKAMAGLRYAGFDKTSR